jgi:AcrR family transcriptional regulator
VDERGLGDLTMKALAERLGVGTMSLYRHVRDREDLLDGVAERMAFEVAIPEVADGDWRAAVVELMRSIRDVGLAHPEAFPLLELRETMTEAGARRQAQALRLLDASGLGARDRATLARALVSYVTGFVLSEITGRPEFPAEADPDSTFRAGLALLLR